MNAIRFGFIAIISLFASAVSAQYYPSQGTPPLVLCNGGYIPQGTPCGGGQYGGQQGMYNGMPVQIPQGVGMGQPFQTMVNGQRLRCSISDRVATAVVDGVAGALIGGAIGKLTGGGFNRGAKIGGAGGAGYGLTLGCDPMITNDGDQGVYQQQRPMQQGMVGGQQGGGYYPQQGTNGRSSGSPSVCRIDGAKPILGYSESDCLALRDRLTNSAPATVQKITEQVTQKDPCAHDAGTKMGVLNLPGHAKNGQTVCARPGDANILKWL